MPNWQDGGVTHSSSAAAVLDGLGGRLRSLRRRRGLTLSDLSSASGIAESSLSRFEVGRRTPSLEQVLALALTLHVSLDELIGAPSTGDPRVNLRPRTWKGRTVIPLTKSASAPQAFKMVLPGSAEPPRPEPHGHEGYEWLYVLNGRLLLVLGVEVVEMVAGEAAEFDTRMPHWFGAAGPTAVEVLALLGPQGERAHVRSFP